MTIQLMNGAPRVYPGVSVTARADMLVVGKVIDEANLTVGWQIHDRYGQMLLAGSADTVEVAGVSIAVQSIIQLPDGLPATYDGEKYYLVWQATWPGFEAQSSEEVVVYETEVVEYGLDNTVNMAGYPIDLHGIVRSTTTDDVTITIFDPDGKSLSPKVLAPLNAYPERLEFGDSYDTGQFWQFWNGHDTVIVHEPVDLNLVTGTYRLEVGGQLFAFDPSTSMRLTMMESLDPYVVQWDQSGKFLGTSQSWVINNNISLAMHEMQAAMERALRYPGLLESAFSNSDYLMFLKMGRDLFNSLQHITNFTMLGADGHMRRMWLICAQYEAASSRQLEEAIKAFDYSGQSTSLTIDISGAYEAYKSSLEAMIESTVKPYKKQLAIRGVIAGDGSSTSIAKGKAPVILSMTYSRVGSAAEYCIGSTYTRYLRPYIQMV
jgi:hypothetical protein